MEDDKIRPDRVFVSVEVLLSKDLTLPVKGLYAAMLALTGKDGVCNLTERQLADLVMIADRRTIRKHIGTLIKAGLAQLQERSRYVMLDPVTNYYATLLKDAQRRLARAEYFGEALMREWLTLLIAVQNYIDNARLPFMRNPQSRELFELDRHYPPRVAFEFNGPQHYGPTVKYPDPTKAAQQEGHDLMKQGLCTIHGITFGGRETRGSKLRRNAEEDRELAAVATGGRRKPSGRIPREGEPALPQPLLRLNDKWRP